MVDFTRESFWKGFWSAFGKEVKAMTKREGFSYWSIPKEEYIRSALYAHIRKHGGYVEVESDFPYHKGKRHGGEADLRFLGKNEFTLVEIKRMWALSGWQNKYPQALGEWKADIKKLDRMQKAYSKSKRTRKCFFLVVFFDSDKLFERAKLKLDEINSYIKKAWGGSTLDFKLDKFKFGETCCLGYAWIER